MMKYKGYGNQSFNPGITIKEIAECLSEWNCENVGSFNSYTDTWDDRYVIAPYDLDSDSESKITGEKIIEMWKWIQSMDKAAYDTLNSLLRGKMVLLIIPPPPPPPPPGNGQ